MQSEKNSEESDEKNEKEKTLDEESETDCTNESSVIF